MYLQEEEEGSEDDNYTKPGFMVTLKTDFSARCFLDQFEDDTDGFISQWMIKYHQNAARTPDFQISMLLMYVVLVIVIRML